MALPVPVPGLVISYAYLWKRGADQGREEGVKDRPCVVILAVKENNGRLVVTVCPITHTPPETRSSKIKVPPGTRRRLGLDEEESWIVVTEVNRFVWPGPDLRPVPRSNPPKFEYGLLPYKLFKAVQKSLIEHYRGGKIGRVRRT